MRPLCAHAFTVSPLLGWHPDPFRWLVVALHCIPCHRSVARGGYLHPACCRPGRRPGPIRVSVSPLTPVTLTGSWICEHSDPCRSPPSTSSSTPLLQGKLERDEATARVFFVCSLSILAFCRSNHVVANKLQCVTPTFEYSLCV